MFIHSVKIPIALISCLIIGYSRSSQTLHNTTLIALNHISYIISTLYTQLLHLHTQQLP